MLIIKNNCPGLGLQGRKGFELKNSLVSADDKREDTSGQALAAFVFG